MSFWATVWGPSGHAGATDAASCAYFAPAPPPGPPRPHPPPVGPLPPLPPPPPPPPPAQVVPMWEATPLLAEGVTAIPTYLDQVSLCHPGVVKRCCKSTAMRYQLSAKGTAGSFTWPLVAVLPEPPMRQCHPRVGLRCLYQNPCWVQHQCQVLTDRSDRRIDTFWGVIVFMLRPTKGERGDDATRLQAA